MARSWMNKRLEDRFFAYTNHVLLIKGPISVVAQIPLIVGDLAGYQEIVTLQSARWIVQYT